MDTKTLVTVALGGVGAGVVVGAAARFKLVPKSLVQYDDQGAVSHVSSLPKLGLYAGGLMAVAGIAAYTLGKTDTWHSLGAGALGAAGFMALTSFVAGGQMATMGGAQTQAAPSTAPKARYQGVAYSTTANQWMAVIQTPAADGTFGTPDASNLRQIPIPGATNPSAQPTDAVAQAAIGTSGVMLVAGNLWHRTAGNLASFKQATGTAGHSASSATLRMMEAGRKNQMAWQAAARQRAATPPGLSHGSAFKRAGIRAIVSG